MMKKLLYISPAPFNTTALGGVQKKILNQANAFIKCGFDVDVLSYYEGAVRLYNIKAKHSDITSRGRSKLDVLMTVPSIIGDYDYVYIRYPMSDFVFLRTLKSIKKRKKIIVVEIPTFPYDSEGKETIKGRIIMALDKCFRKRIHKYIDRICTFSDDDIIYGIPTIKTINGYDFSLVEPDCSVIDTTQCINLIAVSSMYPLHGYDRLIKGLKDYYTNGGTRNIILHIVGTGFVEKEYKSLTESLALNEHVIFHGRVFGNELFELYKGSAMGVNSLAIHRDNLINESTLKTKEYAALGLPIISSSYVDAFSREGNELYTLRVPADETNINIYSIISYLDTLYSNPTTLVREKIRKDAKEVCDMVVTIKPIVDFYESAKTV